MTEPCYKSIYPLVCFAKCLQIRGGVDFLTLTKKLIFCTLNKLHTFKYNPTEMHTYKLFAITCLAILTFSCKKHEKSPLEQLPAPTQEGKNTFGCLLNGRVHVPYGHPTEIGEKMLSASYTNQAGGTFQVQCKENFPGGDFTMLSIGGSNIGSSGDYTLIGRDTKNNSPSALYLDIPHRCTYIDSTDGSKCSGTLHLTKLDKTNKIISGTFTILFTSKTCDTLNFTDGRFDVMYN